MDQTSSMSVSYIQVIPEPEEPSFSLPHEDDFVDSFLILAFFFSLRIFH